MKKTFKKVKGWSTPYEVLTKKFMLGLMQRYKNYDLKK